MLVTGHCEACGGERSLACQTCDGAGISMNDEGKSYCCTVCGGSGHVRCLSCDSSRGEPSFWRSWKSASEAQTVT